MQDQLQQLECAIAMPYGNTKEHLALEIKESILRGGVHSLYGQC